MNFTSIFFPFYFIIKTLLTYPTGDIDIYIDAYSQNDSLNDDDDINFKINEDYFK
mgnify:CR=1 FL=1|tara:strand:+ start:3926 stop:4090 length:165 start_codon:yes stop_codon:yes gene_type:complete